MVKTGFLGSNSPEQADPLIKVRIVLQGIVKEVKAGGISWVIRHKSSKTTEIYSNLSEINLQIISITFYNL